MRTPIDFRNACVSASVFPISSEKISLPAMLVKGVSEPNAWAIPATKHMQVYSWSKFVFVIFVTTKISLQIIVSNVKHFKRKIDDHSRILDLKAHSF